LFIKEFNGEYKTLEKTEDKIGELKETLNSDNPILAIYSNNSIFSPSEIMKGTELPDEVVENPDEYLKLTDIV